MIEILMLSSIGAAQICRPKTMTGLSTVLAPPHPHPHILPCRAAYPLTQFSSLCSLAFLHSLLLWSYMFRPLSQGYQFVFGSRILGFPWEHSKTKRQSGLSFNREAVSSSCRNLAVATCAAENKSGGEPCHGGHRRKVGREGQWTTVFMIPYHTMLTDKENNDGHQGVTLFGFS